MERTPHKNNNPLKAQGSSSSLEAALGYRRMGWAVFPVGKDKRPLIPWAEFQERLPTEVEVRHWWGANPSLGIAVVCGTISGGLAVLDVDPRHGGDDSLDSLGAQGHRLPDTPLAWTGGGGSHHYFRVLEPLPTIPTLAPGLDLKAEGSYIVAPPSIHPSGKHYEWLISPDMEELALVPEWLLEMVKARQTVVKRPLVLPQVIATGQRNTILFRLAAAMRDKGMELPGILAAVQAENARCDPPLTEREVEAIAGSAMRYPPQAAPEQGPQGNGHRPVAEPSPTDQPTEQANSDRRLTDTANAELLGSLWGGQLRYDHRRRRWLIWRKHRWEPDRDGYVERLAVKAARVRYQHAAEIDDLRERQRVAAWAITSESRMRIQAAISLAQSVIPLADSGDNWDTDRWLLGVKNGVVNLKTGLLRPGRPEDRITMSTGVDYDPEAKCPRWEQFLTEVFGDGDLLDWLHRAFGYSISGETTEQVIFIGHGSGANGKTVAVGALHHALGDFAYSAPFNTFELYQRATIPNDLAALEFRRFVTASETTDGTRLNEARIKALSGGDPITARYLNQEFFTFWPHLKLWLFVNHRPKVADDSLGFWRRVRLIPFSRAFLGDAADKHLAAKLLAEASGILAWLVRGCLAWQEGGLEPAPAVVEAATRDYQTESDPLANFLAERCVEHPGATTRASELYTAYKAWAEGEGQGPRETLTATTFGKRMAARFSRTSDRGGRYYTGISLSERGGLVEGYKATVAENDKIPLCNASHESNKKKPPQPSTPSTDSAPPPPPDSCRACGRWAWWWRAPSRLGGAGAWVCGLCHPQPGGANG